MYTIPQKPRRQRKEAETKIAKQEIEVNGKLCGHFLWMHIRDDCEDENRTRSDNKFNANVSGRHNAISLASFSGCHCGVR